MPSYELNFIIKKLSRPALVECLKRVGTNILSNDANVLRKIEYLGSKTPPYKLPDPSRKKMRNSNTKFGSYFIYHCDIPVSEVQRVRGDLKMDTDVINCAFIRRDDVKVTPDYVCTLEEELLPPSSRPSVRKLIAEGRKVHQVEVFNADKSPLTEDNPQRR